MAVTRAASDTFSARAQVAQQIRDIAERVYVERGMRVEICARPVRNQLPAQILKSLAFAAATDDSCTATALLATLQQVCEAASGPCLVDLADLTQATPEERQSALQLLGGTGAQVAPRNVVVNGFGRIGRLLVRQLSTDGYVPYLKLAGIRVRPGTDLRRRAALLEHDSVHGAFNADLQCDPDNSSLIINGEAIPVFEAGGDSAMAADTLLLESTGVGRDAPALEGLLAESGAEQVLLTAPGKSGVSNLVHGISDLSASAKEPVLAAASCTTNAIVPLLAVLEERIGLRHAHFETVHAYTNDQNLVDNAHSSARRGRAAVSNIVMTTTGAADAVVQVLPQLAGRLSANAVRVPVADVSLLALNLQLAQSSSADELRALLEEVSLSPRHRNLIGFSSNPELVSSDCIGDRHACLVDAPALQVTGERGDRCALYAWYDNEAGYCAQVLRLAQDLSRLRDRACAPAVQRPGGPGASVQWAAP